MSMRWLPQVFDVVEEMRLYDETGARAKSANLGWLQALRADVWSAYEVYATAETCSGLTSIVEDLNGNEATALKSNYRRLRSGPMKDFGASLLKRSRTCCLCWHAPAGQLDHHLPQGQFPEFSVLTLNLIPVCALCNHSKGSIYRREDGGPSFLHAYLDCLPSDVQFLVADIYVDATVSAVFKVAATPQMPDSVYKTLGHHFDALELGIMYGNLASELMVEKLTPIYEYYDYGGAEAVERYLRVEARGVERVHGLNHWKPVLLTSLAGSRSFCERGFATLGERDESIFDLACG